LRLGQHGATCWHTGDEVQGPWLAVYPCSPCLAHCARPSGLPSMIGWWRRPQSRRGCLLVWHPKHVVQVASAALFNDELARHRNEYFRSYVMQNVQFHLLDSICQCGSHSRWFCAQPKLLSVKQAITNQPACIDQRDQPRTRQILAAIDDKADNLNFLPSAALSLCRFVALSLCRFVALSRKIDLTFQNSQN